jgi:hypothetical protein
MLTIFSTPKAFCGHIGIIQRNALKSWTLLHPNVEIILFGDEEGSSEVCLELGLRHEPFVERHDCGMKYADFIFKRAQEIARYKYVCYCNCDIILLPDFREAVLTAKAWRKTFLLSSRRWDTDIVTQVDFDQEDWASQLRDFSIRTGLRQSPAYVDYFVFPRGLYQDIPRMVIGRWYWDWWLVWKALASGAPLVDCSPFVTAIHQNHDYGYHPQGLQGTAKDVVAAQNFQLAGEGKNLRNLADATHEVTRTGRIRRTWLRRFRFEMQRFVTNLPSQLWYSLLRATRDARHTVGLNRDGVEKFRSRFKVGRTH